MAAFEYQALDRQGRKHKGIVEGDTPRQARQWLRDQGMTPLSVEAVAQRRKAETHAGWFGGPGLSGRDLAIVTRQLAILVRSGLPLEEALEAVSRQTDKRSVRRLILGVRANVLEGKSLATAFEQFPNAFPPLYRATIDAGESSGKLHQVMGKLAEHLERRQQMGQKVMLALIYPAILTLVSLLVVVGLLTYVVPQIVGVFDSLGQRLPPLTAALIQASAFLREYGWALFAGLAGAWIAFRLILRVEGMRRSWHRTILQAPLIGSFSKGLNAARFTRTLAILAGSGVELLQSLRIAGQVVPNLAMRTAIEEAAVRVREGGSLSRSLENKGLFPPITVHLIASGETSGKLAEMLEAAADNQERDTQALAELFVGIMEPLLILVMGGVVLTIVIAILLPIFEMNQMVH